LAVRPRSLCRSPVERALRIEGVVVELLLLGDEQEVTLDVAAVGRVVAVMDSRVCRNLRLGARIELFAPASEVVLVAK
jgi:putative spermidine/putrescine transport system ATP-binding protein